MTQVLFRGDPSPTELRAAGEEVKAIRSELAHLRTRLRDVGRWEADLPHDRSTADVEGALTLSLIALHRLVDGSDRSFSARAERVQALHDEAASNPDAFVWQDGCHSERRERELHLARRCP